MGTMQITDLNQEKRRIERKCLIVLGEDFDTDFIYEDVDFTKPSSIKEAYSKFIEESKNATVRTLRQMLFKIDSDDSDAFRRELFNVKKQDSPATNAQIKKAKKIIGNRFGNDAFLQLESSDKELDIKSIKDLIKNPSPKMIKQYGGKDKYIKMLKSKLAKLESTDLEEAKRMKYDKVIKKLKDGEWDTSMDVKQRMHLTYTDNNTGKKKVVFVEADDLEEAVKWWTVTITKKAGKLFKGQTVDVKARNSAEAIKKGIKQMKGNPSLVPSDSVDAVLGESTLNYARTLKAIEKDRKDKGITKKDKETLAKIADLMKRLKEEKTQN